MQYNDRLTSLSLRDGFFIIIYRHSVKYSRVGLQGLYSLSLTYCQSPRVCNAWVMQFYTTFKLHWIFRLPASMKIPVGSHILRHLEMTRQKSKRSKDAASRTVHLTGLDSHCFWIIVAATQTDIGSTICQQDHHNSAYIALWSSIDADSYCLQNVYIMWVPFSSFKTWNDFLKYLVWESIMPQHRS